MRCNIRAYFCGMLLIAIGFAGLSAGEPATLNFNAESIGKQDPFEMVRPMLENRPELMARNPGPNPAIAVEKPELYVEAVMLKFLQASNMQLAVASMNTPFGSVSTDQETNTLIICDTKEQLEKIVTQVRKADQTPRQILIEVVILDVQLNDDTEVGVDWNTIFGDNANDFDTVFGNTANPDYSGAVHKRAFNTSLTTLTGGGAFGWIHDELMVRLRALEVTRNVEILANPKVLVVSGQTANIKTIEEIPYEEVSDSSEGGAAALTTTVFKEVGVTLTVRAVLMDDDRIMMMIRPEQSVNTGRTGINNVPIVDKRQAETTLLMESGEVFLMGGLRRKETTSTREKVPLLGDLPILGFLFSSDQEVIKKSELLVLIAPKIHNGEPLTEYQMRRFNEMRNAPPLELPDEDRPEAEILKEVTPSIRK